MKIKIEVMLRDAILDPQGNTIKKSLNSLGFKNVKNVGISAGASTPDYLIKEVTEQIKSFERKTK